MGDLEFNSIMVGRVDVVSINFSSTIAPGKL